MGLFCMILGGAIYAGFTLGGFMLASALMSDKFVNWYIGHETMAFSEFFQFPSGGETAKFLIIWGFISFIGLMAGLSLFMNGMIYNKVNRLKRRRRD